MLKVCLNGRRSPGEHSALPITPAQLAADATACAGLGVGAVHLHPRDDAGRETLAVREVDATVRTVRAVCGLPVGVSTGAWMEPEPDRRAAYAASWNEPDFASVNLSEPGAEIVMRALLNAGIGVEAGVWSADDAERLAATGLGDRLTRVLVEVIDTSADAAVAVATEIVTALDTHGLTAPRLVHGEEDACWPVLRHAFATGYDSRIGLEDTLVRPDGGLATGNADLVATANRVAQQISGGGGPAAPRRSRRRSRW